MGGHNMVQNFTRVLRVLDLCTINTEIPPVSVSTIGMVRHEKTSRYKLTPKCSSHIKKKSGDGFERQFDENSSSLVENYLASVLAAILVTGVGFTVFKITHRAHHFFSRNKIF